MSAYAIAHLQEAAPHGEIAEYIERITDTFTPYGGRFLVHGAQHEVKEGSWPGHVVVIGFPSLAQAREWWGSDAYQKIAPLRSRHIQGDIVLVPGVADGYDATATARVLRESLPARQPA
ncbi:DUF1330 domain-containing protein [Streptomyces sp. NBC_00199]|uniref:DUF1330 domain-containing protein n=1 Tax=Streptomyces sp. NBC_00199 TaxID=2975678 RepID=UPI00225678C8|nr:DUF1330 domain-containing protein [Streptomyces sp. NBC_00199]MCX5264773.1 DUF1330 domain-containing protein [Streptomyces sp. NBC_00199]